MLYSIAGFVSAALAASSLPSICAASSDNVRGRRTAENVSFGGTNNFQTLRRPFVYCRIRQLTHARYGSVTVPFVDTGSYPTRAGNQVVAWIDGEPAFRRVCEVIELAEESVLATVTFMWPSFQMPDGRGTALDVLERAARRGVDVRVIFWRPDDETAGWRRNAFWGSNEHFQLLSQRYAGINIRWDRAHPGGCQHQKTWLIDAHRDGGTSFVGGINLNPHSLATSDHRGNHHNHDVCVEVTGPAVADVHHNFVQRWNGASEGAETRRRPRARRSGGCARPCRP